MASASPQDLMSSPSSYYFFREAYFLSVTFGLFNCSRVYFQELPSFRSFIKIYQYLLDFDGVLVIFIFPEEEF